MLSSSERCSSLKLSHSIAIFFCYFLSSLHQVENIRLSRYLGAFGERMNNDPEFKKMVNISQEEYATKIAEFYNSSELPRILKILDKASSEIHQPGIIITFEPHGFDDVEISTAEVKMLIPPTNDNRSLELLIRVIDLTGEAERSYITRKTAIHLSEDEPKWVEFRLTDAAKKWVKNNASEWKLLFEGLHVKPKEVYLNVIVRPSPPVTSLQERDAVRHKRGLHKVEYADEEYDYYLTEEDLLSIHEANSNYHKYIQNDLSKSCKFEDTRYERPGEKFCCRLEVPLILESMKDTHHLQDQLWHILAPDIVVFTHCQGLCPKLAYPVTNHTLIQHALILSNEEVFDKVPMCLGKKRYDVETDTIQDMPNFCCAPVNYASTQILQVSDSDPTHLLRLHLKDAVVKNCACI